MKINAVISKPSVKLNNGDKTAIISAAAIAFGIITGAMIYSVSNNTVFNEICDYFLSYATDFTHKNKPEIFSGIIISYVPYIIAMFILGTSIVGAVGTIALSTVKSMGIGLLFTYIYDAFSLKGIEYCLLILLPGKFILIFAMILLTQSCCMNSLAIRKSLSNFENGAVPLQKYLLRSVVILLLFVLSSLADFLMLTSFSSLFDFT